jgi:ABC-type transport system involved in multi-copper enzyme maturation permease subunit
MPHDPSRPAGIGDGAAFAEVFRFECAYQVRSPLFWVLAGAFFVLAFVAMASENVQVGGGTGNLDLNAHFAVLQTMQVFSVIAVLAVVAFVASPLMRDSEQKTLELFLSTGVPKWPWLLGRYAAGTLFAIAVTSAALLGTLVGTFAPWLEPERLAPFSAGLWLYAEFAVVMPAMVIVSGLFFAATCFWRSIMAGYLVAIALIVLLIVAGANTDAETIGFTALLDPFGQIAFGEATRYWTPAELGTRLPAYEGNLLANRLIWLAISLVAAFVGARHYRLELPRSGGAAAAETTAVEARPRPEVRVRTEGMAIALAQFLSQLSLDAKAVLRSAPLWVLLLFGVFNTVGGLLFATSQLYGTPVLPTTALMVDSILGTFSLMVFMALVYYAAELVTREHTHGVFELVDATPSAAWTRLVAKTVVVWGVVLAMYGVAIVTGMVVQLIKGFEDIRPGVYVVGLFLQQGWGLMIFATLAVFLQALVDRKFIGMFIVLVVFLAVPVLGSLGFERVLYTLGPVSPAWSDFHGFGHTLAPTLLTGTYWSLFAVLLLVGAHLVARRGTETDWRGRLATARTRLTVPVIGLLAVTTIAFAGVGVEIWRQTEVVREFLTSDEIETLQADYEKQYAHLRMAVEPQVVDVDVAVDLHPRDRRFEAAGHYLLEHSGEEALAEMHLSMYPGLEIERLEVAGATRSAWDEDQGFGTWTFAPPLAPGEQLRVDFAVARQARGFSPNSAWPRMNWNGTFVDLTDVLPLVGYDSSRELGDPDTRREQDLPPVVRLPEYDDPRGRRVAAFGSAARTGFRSVVSTSGDQIAVAPGTLLREWTETVEGEERAFFEYRMDQPILPFFAWLSARYEKRTRQIDDVLVEVFHHPEHDWNVDAMIDGAEKSLAYFEREFSDYQYDQYRIFEFPRFATFAQAFPGTIPFSEAIGFTADLSDEDDLDYVLFVTAHEFAHQWWAHQVIGANVQGTTMLTETLAQYSALMVMEQEWGEEKIRRFLRYELDQYLSGRGGELVGELPLKLVENQPYIHYRKGAVAMYALRDAIGEAAVNRALRRLIEDYAFAGPPFPRSGDLIALFREEAGPEHQQLITDLFERIVLWDLAVTEAEVTEEEDGRWRVEATVRARMFEADAEGNETEIPLDTNVDLAVFARSEGDLGRYELPETLYRERRRLDTGEHQVTIIVDEQPSRIGVDPFHRLIDRIPEDNVRTL